MKKFFGKLGRWLLGIIVFLLVLAIIYMIVFRSSIKKMTPADTARLTEDVYAVRDKYVNMYLVRDGNNFIAVDAGIKPRNIRGELKKLDIDPERVKAVFLTLSALGVMWMWLSIFADVGVTLLCVLNALRIIYVQRYLRVEKKEKRNP